MYFLPAPYHHSLFRIVPRSLRKTAGLLFCQEKCIKNAGAGLFFLPDDRQARNVRLCSNPCRDFAAPSITTYSCWIFAVGKQSLSVGKSAGADTNILEGIPMSMWNSVSKMANGLVLGLAVKMFTIAGPIIVFGIASSVLVGLVYYFIYWVL